MPSRLHQILRVGARFRKLRCSRRATRLWHWSVPALLLPVDRVDVVSAVQTTDNGGGVCTFAGGARAPRAAPMPWDGGACMRSRALCPARQLRRLIHLQRAGSLQDEAFPLSDRTRNANPPSYVLLASRVRETFLVLGHSLPVLQNFAKYGEYLLFPTRHGVTRLPALAEGPGGADSVRVYCVICSHFIDLVTSSCIRTETTASAAEDAGSARERTDGAGLGAAVGKDSVPRRTWSRRQWTFY